MTISLFLIFCISFIFYLLGEFSFSIGQLAIPVYFIIQPILLIIVICKNYKNFLYNFNFLIRTKPLVYFSFFCLWVILTIIVSIPQGTFMLGSFFTNFIGNFFSSFFFPMLIMCILISHINDTHKIKKFIFIIYLTVLVLGIIEMFALTHNIEIIKNILSVLVNRTELSFATEKVFAVAYEKPRIETFFREAGEYAGFLVVSCPIIFYLGSLKEKFFKNYFVDMFLKQAIKILWFINLLLTQSPINMVFIILVGAYWLFANRKTILKAVVNCYKNIAGAIGVTAVSIIAIVTLIVIGSSGNSFLSRITTTITNIKSVDALVEDEASLATRICTHEAQMYMGLNYPIFGVGYGNINSVWPQYVLNLPHMLTPEVYSYAVNGKQRGGSAFLWKIFSETGFPGVILLYIFWISLWKHGNKIKNKSSEKDFINALNSSLAIYVCFSWYLMLAPIFMVYYGILLGYIHKYKKDKYLLSTKEF